MANAFALKKLEKAGAISTSGLKKSKIKKYESEYHVPIAYVGLLTLVDQKSSWNNMMNFEGTLPFKTAIGDGEVEGWMQIETDKDNPTRSYDYSDEDFEMRQRAKDPNDIEAQTWMDNFKLREENTADFQQVTVKGGLRYTIVTSKGEEEVFKASRGRFASVEECLEYLEQIGQEGWGEVNIKVSDLSLELNAYNAMEDVLPSKIDIPTTLGTLELKDDWGEYEGTLSNVNDENIGVEIKVHIRPIKNVDADRYNDLYISGEEMRNRTVKPESYEISVVGTISDKNTNVSVNIGSQRNDQWQRYFGREGALSLEDAKSIVLQNCEEIITEYNEFSASARNYEQVSHGRGYQRTTVNTEPWDYNFGDRADDIEYLEWQDREYEDRVFGDIHNIIDMDYNHDGPVGMKGSIANNSDGTFTFTIEVGRDVEYNRNEALVEDVTSNGQDYNRRVLDSVLSNLRMNGYEIVSTDIAESVHTLYNNRSWPILIVKITVKPTVRKSKMIKTAIKRTFNNFKKAFKKE